MKMDKRKEEYIFGGVLAVVLIVVLVLLLVLHPKSTPSAITLTDSGSTNTGSWTLTINPDGSGTAKVGAHFSALIKSPTTLPYDKNTFKAKQIIAAINSTAGLKDFKGTCLRSASFGTVLTMHYKNLTVKNFDCYLNVHSTTPLGKAVLGAINSVHLPY
jgi:hypothetical protein